MSDAGSDEELELPAPMMEQGSHDGSLRKVSGTQL